MKTLVMHPTDPTTDFLKEIYDGKGYNVINDCQHRHDIVKAIESHNRIIMLGHGTPIGMFYIHGGNSRIGAIQRYGYAIDRYMADILRDKETIGIWCNADLFALENKIRGYYTGMIISELEEAILYDVKATQEEIDHSNTLFAKSMKHGIENDDIFNTAKKYYVGDSDVIKFNLQSMRR